MTEMCSASSRADALNALTLVENVARLSTQGLFGFVFAALAQIGKPHLTFFANAVSSSVSDSEGLKVGCWLTLTSTRRPLRYLQQAFYYFLDSLQREALSWVLTRVRES
jgi:hypothetical protein